jgi:hypothetical protein
MQEKQNARSLLGVSAELDVRHKLLPLVGKRAIFRGIYQQSRRTTGDKGGRPIALFTSLKLERALVGVSIGPGSELADHVHVVHDGAFVRKWRGDVAVVRVDGRSLSVCPGSVVVFSACVARYSKSVVGKTETVFDYGLESPAAISVVMPCLE